MWEASWGIILVIVVMFGIGMLASPAKGKTRARSRQNVKTAMQGAGGAGQRVGKKRETEQAALGTPLPIPLDPTANQTTANIADIATGKKKS
jgi:hypothetical protein